MRKHPARLSAAGITPARYDELRAICRQYRECKRRLAWAHAGIVDRPERRSSSWHRPDPTGNTALALADHPDARRVKLIEQCAAAVAEPVIARCLIKYVTEGKAWEYQTPQPPIGRNQFYVTAQRFFIELDRSLLESTLRG